MADEAIGVCSPENMRELLALLRWAKQSGFMLQSHNKRPMIADAPRLYVAYTTEEVTARSGTTAGKGKATLKYIPGVAGTATAIEDLTTSEIDVYNITQSVIEIDKWIFVNRENGSGKYVIVLEACE